MKRRKILYLFPLAALILSGCTFQEGWETVKGFASNKVYEPAKSFVEKLLGKEQKKEEKEDNQGGSQQGSGQGQGQGQGQGGGQGGGGQQSTTNYGSEASPLSVAEALAIVEEECAEENALSKQAMVVEGVIYSAIKTYDYDEGPAFECYLGNDEEQIYIYRVHGAEADKPNFKEGSTLKFRGFAKNYKGTLEFCDNGSEKCTVLSLEKPQGTEAVTGIEFDEQVYELQVGQTKKVTASVLPLNAGNQNYTLSLNNVSPEGCVSLGADNVLTANAVGTAKMVATTEEGGFTAEIDVTVIAAINYGTLENPLTIAEAMEVINKESPTKQTVYVTGEVKSNKAYSTQYNNTEIWLTDGENDFELYGCSLPEGFTPAQPVQDDPALVGKIVVAHGTAKKYKDTYELDKGCAIDTVSEPAPIVIESVTVTPSTLELEVGEQANISATVSPAKANQEVTWKVQNPENLEVANYQDGKIIAVAAGEATVVATSVADPKVSGLCSVVVTEATKTLESIAITGEATKTEYVEEEAYSADGLKVMAHYDKGDDVDVTDVAEITVSPTKATYGDTKFTVTATYSTAAAVTKDVAVTVAIKHGSEAHPYTGAEAAAIAAQLENQAATSESYYIKGTVIDFNETFNSSYGNYSFTIDGGFVGWRLKNGSSYEKFNAGDIEIGDVVTMYVAIQNYNGTPESKGGYVHSVEKGEIESVIVSGTPEQTEYAVGATYNHKGLIATAVAKSGVSIDVTNKATWTLSKETAEVGDTEITVTATFNNVASAAFAISVTVSQDAPPAPTYYDATMAKGDTNSYDDVTINDNAAIKMGKSNYGGNMTITVPTGAVVLKFYAVAWNGKGGSSYPVTISGATVSPASFDPVANSSVSGSAKAFTLDNVDQYLIEVTLSGITQSTTLTLTSTERVIVWGAQYGIVE